MSRKIETLEAQRVTITFEGIRALESVDLVLNRGEIVGLIGPNGAGKTTLVNVISGFLEPTEGSVLLKGLNVTGWPAERIARKGLARSFQGGRLFGGFTVLENIEAGAVGSGLGRREAVRRAAGLLERMNLSSKAGVRADSLPAGDQRRLGVLRALALMPEFLLLDEPAAGLNEQESDDLVAGIRAVRRDFGCGVLVIDHDMRVIMSLCERIEVLNYGRVICIGDPRTVRSDPGVIAAYLGTNEPVDADR